MLNNNSSSESGRFITNTNKVGTENRNKSRIKTTFTLRAAGSSQAGRSHSRSEPLMCPVGVFPPDNEQIKPGPGRGPWGPLGGHAPTVTSVSGRRSPEFPQRRPDCHRVTASMATAAASRSFGEPRVERRCCKNENYLIKIKFY